MKPEFLSAVSYHPKHGKGLGVAFAVTTKLHLSPAATKLDKEIGGLITRAMTEARFTGKPGQVTRVVAPQGQAWDQILLVGLGEEKKLDALAFEAAGGTLVGKANMMGITALHVVLDAVPGKKLKKGEAEAHLAFGAELKDYRFDKYLTKQKPEDKPTLTALAVVTPDAAEAKKLHAPLDALRAGMFLTRDIVSEPANVIHPESLAAECKKLEADGVKVTVLGEKEMKKLGMGALLGVGQGSVRESQLVIMEWNGGKKGEAPLAFVGKGVCFDTGGISIKPSGGMEEMKWDMGGAGTVIGLMKTLALRKAKVNVVGVGGLVENMPDGNAQRPGDIVISMSGQTIEVLNTDAEGRLVLADALWYAQDRYKPKFIVDLATLTGAIIVALGKEYAGLFSNDDKLAERIARLGEETGEKTWRLPLGDAYDKQINSPVADMQNIGKEREAGSITAAQFLQRFVNDTPWAHLDIAGTAWSKEDKPTTPKGATAFGVRLLNALVREHYEG
jgi:leucyl aminopeptidase